MLLCALVPSWASAQATGDEPFDSGWILGQLKQPAPAATPFLELRESELLEAPMRISGEYRRPDADTLVRQVSAPYVETTTLKDGRATIEREGRSPRSFPLSRAPAGRGFDPIRRGRRVSDRATSSSPRLLGGIRAFGSEGRDHGQAAG